MGNGEWGKEGEEGEEGEEREEGKREGRGGEIFIGNLRGCLESQQVYPEPLW